MARKRFVFVEGSLREVVDGYRIVIADRNWYNFGGTWAPADAPPSTPSAMVMPDISPYRSTITGEIINSRSTHRDHLRQHNCIEVGNEKPRLPEREWTATRGLREELIARLNG